jgi:hypothetical protein
MKMLSTATLAAAAALCMAQAQAQAVTLFDGNFNGERETNTSFNVNFNAGASGAAAVTFELQGYRSLDGDNYWIDVFNVSLNGNMLFSGTENLGGGGYGAWYVGPPTGQAWWSGPNAVTAMLPFTALAGANTLTFSYTSPTEWMGSARAGFQGAGDEAWGVNRVTISGVAAVPEPETYALMLAGLAGVAFIARRKQAAR